jgi:hypothetical protein
MQVVRGADIYADSNTVINDVAFCLCRSCVLPFEMWSAESRSLINGVLSAPVLKKNTL